MLFKGGSLGSALVNVRSVGGGEPWDAIFGRFPTPDNDTIAAFLSKRDSKKRAYAGADYKTLDVLLDFKVRSFVMLGQLILLVCFYVGQLIILVC